MKQRLWTSLATLLGAVLVLAPGPAEAVRYTLSAEGGSRVVFVSKAPLESFEGKTDQLSGWLDADLDNLAGKVALEIEVQLASFDTGKKKRNRHMRENHLETSQYPVAVFRGEEILAAEPASLAAGGQATLKLRGNLDLHGVVRQREIDLQVRRGPDGDLQVTGSFPVLLSEHDIKRPKFLVMKLADEQIVKIDLRLQPTIQ